VVSDIKKYSNLYDEEKISHFKELWFLLKREKFANFLMLSLIIKFLLIELRHVHLIF